MLIIVVQNDNVKLLYCAVRFLTPCIQTSRIFLHDEACFQDKRWYLERNFIVVKPKTEYSGESSGSPNLLPGDWFRQQNCILGNLEPKFGNQ